MESPKLMQCDKFSMIPDKADGILVLSFRIVLVTSFCYVISHQCQFVDLFCLRR